MEFHSLTRRELQALCKKNKIPANITNAAMADALKALEIVEGIEELMQPSQSETAQSSIESLEGSEVTSPYVPPTAGRSTRRRNVLKEEFEAVTSVTTTRRTTRKTAAKVSHESQVDTMETPALVSQTSRRKGQMASACRKMDSQLKECAEEEEKKGVSMTPAPLGVTSRRRRVEVGTVQKVYSTRRSVRLAEKNVEMLTDEESELFNNELLTKDGENQEVNLKEANELSGITGVDAIANMEEIHENEEKSEVVSAEEQYITIGELELGSTGEEESCIKFAGEAQPNKEISDTIEFPGGEDSVKPVNVSDEGKQSEGAVDVCTSEIETTVQNSKELDIEIDVAGDSVEHVLLESKDEIAEDDDAEFYDEVKQEPHDDKEIDTEDVQDFNVTLVKLTELRLKQEDAEVVSPQRKVADDIEEAESDFTDQLPIPEQLKKTEPDEMETLGHDEESDKAADEEQASEAAGNALASEKNSPSKQLSGVEEVPLEMGVDLAEHIPTSQVVQPNKSSSMILSDNKENIGSGTKLVIMKVIIKPAKDSGESLNDLSELSLRKLTKMFKEKLEITKKSSNEALPRTALQALPENQAEN